MMRKEAREWCQYEDGEYIKHLTQQIVYFNERLVIRNMEGSPIQEPVLEIIKVLEKELDTREEEYRREYGNKTGECVFRQPEEDTGQQDSNTNSTDNVVTDAKLQDARPSTGKDDGYRSSNFYGKDIFRDADNDGLGDDRSSNDIPGV